jgi:hypothetical protein
MPPGWSSKTERRDVAGRLARLLHRSGGRSASGRFVVEWSTREPERTHVFEAVSLARAIAALIF